MYHNLIDLERFCKDEQNKFSKARCSKLEDDLTECWITSFSISKVKGCVYLCVKINVRFFFLAKMFLLVASTTELFFFTSYKLAVLACRGYVDL